MSKIDLSIYTKVVLFVGAKQSKIDLGDKKYDSPIELVLVQLKATQSNNLDFHLSYYLGKYDGDAPIGVSFDIISNDKGFSPLIAHIKINGRACKQVKVAAAPSAKDEQVKVASAPTAKSKLISFITASQKTSVLKRSLVFGITLLLIWASKEMKSRYKIMLIN